jgi:hypothetical protein
VPDMPIEPVRLPDAASVKAVLARLAPETADAQLTPCPVHAFPGFSFTAITVDDPYWRDARTVVSPDGTRLGDHRAWISRVLAAIGGDLTAFWTRHRSGEFQFAE